MGTRFEFILVGEDESHLRTVGEEAIAEIQYLHDKFNYFSTSSIVTRINERAAIGPVDVDRRSDSGLERVELPPRRREHPRPASTRRAAGVHPPGGHARADSQ
jgi:hypothetical protein